MKRLATLALCAGLFGCPKASSNPQDNGTPPSTIDSLPGHGGINQDTAPKEAERLMPAEAYIRSYMSLFAPLLPAGGKLTPLAVQTAVRGSDASALFDTWDDYLFELGLPDYRNELPRGTQTNALMMAAFERLGVALCDRAVEHDLRGAPMSTRAVFPFDPPASTPDQTHFAPLFDQVHRTFLGYPAALAPTDRVNRYYTLFTTTIAAHAVADAGASRFKPQEAGWAAVCYGLIRHPEFHAY